MACSCPADQKVPQKQHAWYICMLGGQREQNTVPLRQSKLLSPQLDSDSIRNIFFSSFCYKPMLHIHWYPHPLVGVYTRLHAWASVCVFKGVSVP